MVMLIKKLSLLKSRERKSGDKMKEQIIEMLNKADDKKIRLIYIYVQALLGCENVSKC